MKFLLTALLAMSVTASLVYWGLHEPGYVLMAWKNWSVEMPLGLFAAFLFLAFGLVYVLLRLWFRAVRTPAVVSKRLARLRHERARRHLINGLLEYAEGRWERAEKLLSKNAADSETPVLNYLAAANAAHRLQAYDRRDKYLRQAIVSDPKAEIAVELSQAQMQLDRQQTEQALATLKHLREIAPDHAYVMRLLGKLYLQTKEWKELERLLPRLRRHAHWNPEKVAEIETEIVLGLFEQAQRKRDLDALKKTWESLPHKSRQRPQLLGAYAMHLATLGCREQAERLLSKYLKSHWDEALAAEYGSILTEVPARQLITAEAWLQRHPHSQGLLLSLARLSKANKLWGKARSYYEAALSEHPDTTAYFELGELLTQLGETQAAAENYRHGLKLAIESQTPTPRSVEAPEPGVITTAEDDSQSSRPPSPAGKSIAHV